MKIETLNGFGIYESNMAGSNVKGHKKTNGIQVREYINDGYLLLATFRYTVGDTAERNAAIEKARNYINEY